MKFVITSADYFDNVMTKFIVNNRTDALKTDINLFFYDNKLSTCALSLADVSHEFQIYVSVDNKNKPMSAGEFLQLS